MAHFPLQDARNAVCDPQVDGHLDALRPVIRKEYTFTLLGDYRTYPRPDPNERIPATEEDTDHILGYLEETRPRLNAVICLLKECEGQRGLDVGICYGLVDIVLRETYGVLIEGAELPLNIPAYCALALNRGIPITPWALGTPSPFEPESFDFVVFMEVLEHLKLPPGRTIHTLGTLIRPGGMLILTTPNLARYGNIAALIRGERILEPYREDLPESVDVTDYVGHIREYTVGEVVEYVEHADLVIEQLLMCNQWSPHERLHPNPLLNDIMIVCAGKPGR